MDSHTTRGVIGGIAGSILAGLFLTSFPNVTDFGAVLFLVFEFSEVALAITAIVLLIQHNNKLITTQQTQQPQQAQQRQQAGPVNPFAVVQPTKTKGRGIIVLGISTGTTTAFLFFMDGLNRIKPILTHVAIERGFVTVLVGFFVVGLIISLVKVE